MKKLNLFWKIMLIVLPLTTTGAFGILAWNLYQKMYGRCSYVENYSRGLKKIFYRSGAVRVLNIQTGNYTTPKLNWIAKYDSTDSLTVFAQDHKRGYLSLYNGKIVIPAQYQSAWQFSEGLGAVIKNNRLGFIDTRGNEVIPLRFFINPVLANNVDFLFKQGHCTMLNENSKQGLINKKGEWVIQPEYDYIRNPKHGFRVIIKDKKAGLLDSLLHFVLPIKYDAITIADDGLVIANNGLQQKLSFDTHTVINPLIYDDVNAIYYNSGKVNDEGADIQLKSDYTTFIINNKIGLMDKNGKVVLKAFYDEISALTNDLFYCKVGDQGITMNSNGQEVKQ